MSRLARARFALAATLLLGLTACDAVGNMFSPGSPASEAPARLSLQASVPRFQQSAFTRLELRVVAQYVRSNQSLVPIGTQLITLTSETTQRVPVSVELGACLADEQRLDAAVEPPACRVTLTLTLLGDGRALDSFQLANLRLVPGGAAVVPQPVQLFEIASVSLTGPGGPLGSVPVEVRSGSTVTLGAAVLDGGGAAVSGRTVEWSSSNSAVATVSTAGVVTGVAPGSALITATVGGRSATANVTVTPPTQRLEIVAVPGNGTGRITSTPSGIDCAISAGNATGSCAADFTAGVSVELLAAGASPSTALFSGWTGACLASGSAPSCSLTVTAPVTIGASFAALAQLQIGPGGNYPGITVLSNTQAAGGQLFNCDLTGFTGNCALPFLTGTTVSLFASESGIARITTWNGCDSFTRSTCEVNVGSTPRSVEVQGTLGNVVRTNLVDSSGQGRVSAANAGGSVLRAPINCGTAVPSGQQVCASGYPAGSTVTVSAIESPESRFTGWTDPDCDQVVGLNCIIQNTTGDGRDIVLDFGFELNPFRLTLTLTGGGGGTVFDQIGDPLCVLGASETSRQCELSFPNATLLSLGGQPAGTGQFLGFGGDCAPGLSCLITVDQPRNVTAEFSAIPAMVPVTIAAEPSNAGFGYIVSDNNDIECDVTQLTVSGACSTMRPAGSVMTLTAFDDERILTSNNHVFTRWAPGSPCAGSPEPVCTFTVPPTPIVAQPTFVAASEVFVLLGGSGSLPGTLTAFSSGFRALAPCAYVADINPADCIFLLPTGAIVSLAVTPESGGTADVASASFCTWTGNASCSFPLLGDESGFIFILSMLLEEGTEQQFASSGFTTFDHWLRAGGRTAER